MSPGTLPSVAGVSDEKSVYEGAGFGTMRWKMRPLQRLDLVPGRGQVGDGEVSSLSSWEGGVRDDESEEAVSPCTVTTIPDDEDRRKET
jgi:ATP-dependent DNA ligase